jgi:ABC-type multidrug transport system ATPase subunit
MKSEGLAQDRLQLLCNVSGSFRPGVLTTLMGISGAGKTTLMDVLAGRKSGGYIEGNISISGFPNKQETFSRISGYCEQNDIHSPNVTVFESVVFSTWLRLSCEVDEKTRMVDQNFSPPCIQCFRVKISFPINETMQATFTHRFVLLQ